MLAVISTIVCIGALGGLLTAESSGAVRERYTFKPIASLGFVLVALLGGALTADAPVFCLWIVIGLVLGALGDIALMLPGRRAFLTGLVSFLAGHIAYIIGFHYLTPISSWTNPTALIPVIFTIPVLLWLWPHLGSMKGPVIAYVIVITTMVVGALAVLMADDPGGLTTREVHALVGGAVLFYISDLAVARQRFVVESPTNRMWGLPAYYGGQLLLAWSAVWASGA